ncbi:TPA: hypothetical protein HA265_00505 [Candidatus Woesearchaeota archaeon]|nr:hypothetical protein [Candidatus Woesearchaeota archaeon]
MALDDEKVMKMREDMRLFRIFADHVAKHLPELHDFSFENMLVISDDEFAGLYLTLMETLTVSRRWWVGGNTPPCSSCGREITGPGNLRMYHDNPYHPGCFRQVYDEKDESDLMKRYWTRVLALDGSDD